MKRQSTEWEKIFANEKYDKELISRICKELFQLNNKNQTAQFKNKQKTNRISLKKIYEWPISICKDAQYYYALGTFISKLQ